MLKFTGVRGPVCFNYLHEPVVRLLNLAATWSHRMGKHVLVTSGNDHQHGDSSLHYQDKAIDFDVEGNRTADLQLLATYLRKHAGPEFDILFEGNHVHGEHEASKVRVNVT